MQHEYVHLNCHSEYSIIDGILRLKPFIAKIKKFGMHSVALTDQSNLFAMIKFYKIAINMGIKPIIGSDIWFKSSNHFVSSSIDNKNNNYYRLTLLCQNELGLNNLMQLISRSYNNWEDNKPFVNQEWLFKEKLHTGLIAIAPMFDSDITHALLEDNFALATNLATNWSELFENRFYLAITRIGKSIEESIISKILHIANHIIPIVASFEVRFLEPEDFIAHEARICINQGLRLDDSERKTTYTNRQYLKNPDAMHNLFLDLPTALINSQEIAKRCNVNLNLGKTYLPEYKTPKNLSEYEYLTKLAIEGLMQRLNCTDYAKLPEQYTARLNIELSVINSMGFAGYFLIVADIIQWSLKNDIPVGPGRGSGAGSLVAFALFITNINPLSYGLLFERFLNPERVSMPDFDIDFCIYGRDFVIDYVAKKYGQDSVAQIITYGTMAAKAAIRDIGRVLGCPYSFVDQIAKLIPLEIGMTITKALEQEAILKTKYEEDDEVKSIIDLAIKLEGIIRNVGKHAGGLVISPKPIVNFSPLYFEANNSSPVTQFDKNDIEDIGLVKFDFLGLKTLTIIDLAVKSINKHLNNFNQNTLTQKQKLNINHIPLNDPATFNLLSDGNTIAVFQLESRGMRELTIKLQPSCFEDLIAIGALYRPGPLQSGMVDDFINRKRGKDAIQYPHPDLTSILESTYGVIVYQEQVMQIAQVLAGYTLGAADLLRRAMGKKKPEEMAKQRKIFVQGVCNLDLNREESSKLGVENAGSIFNLIDKFAGYGFNKSHAAAYALITYQTAWLKTHYPADFMAAVLSLDLNNTDKIIMFIVDCRKFKIKIASPNINTCEYRFIATGSKEINYGLGAIKGVGEIAINHIIAARQSGEFKDLLDLCLRVDLHKISRKTLESLIKSGALDCFNLHRAALLHYLEIVIKITNKSQQRSSKQLDLFSNDTKNLYKTDLQFLPDICPKWDHQQILLEEKKALGFYFSNHPITEFEDQLSKLGVIKFNQANLNKKIQKFAGSIVAIRLTRTKKGDKMAFITLDDAIERQDILIFADLYQTHKELLKKDQLIIIEGEVTRDNFTGGFKIKCNKIINFYETFKKMINNLTIILNPLVSHAQIVTEKIKQIIHKNPGNCPLVLHYHKAGTLTTIKLGDNWSVDPKKQLITDLKKLTEIEDAYINY